MERHAQWRQLDLLELAMTALQRQRLDPMMRKELASLTKAPDQRMRRHPRKNEGGGR